MIVLILAAKPNFLQVTSYMTSITYEGTKFILS